ncbi:MAG: SIMPL domain-containing protein, partial [Syntrophaceae bacterium]|nr:SIMPL domain-containing protein [Syntrophaceae bacterium]
MVSNENRTVILAAVIVGISLIVGITLGGYFVGKGGARFKSDIRTVTVKGLVEKEVKADQAIWVLRFRRAGEDIKDVHMKISSDREAAIAFL